MISKLLNQRKIIRRERRRSIELRNFAHWRSVQLCLELENRVLERTDSCVGNQEDLEIIVSLTTYDKRIDNVFYTIETLMRQTLAPDRILLHIHEDFCGEHKLPKTLVSQAKRGLEIVPVPRDLGPHTKYFYALKDNPNSLIITVDDDILYPVDTVEKLYRAYRQQPDIIHCNRAHRILTSSIGGILDYKRWDFDIHSSDPSLAVFPTGVGGVLYFPGCLDPAVLDSELFMRIAPMADDVWLKAMSLKQNTLCAKVDDVRNFTLRFPTIPDSQLFTLKRSNKKSEAGNDAQLSKVFEQYNLNLVSH